MLRGACVLLACTLLGAQEAPWFQDRLEIRFQDSPLPEIPAFGPARRKASKPGATVVISEAAPSWERFQSFRLDFTMALRKALTLPPPRLQAIELTDFMRSDPNHPERADIQRAIHALTPPSAPGRPNAPR